MKPVRVLMISIFSFFVAVVIDSLFSRIAYGTYVFLNSEWTVRLVGLAIIFFIAALVWACHLAIKRGAKPIYAMLGILLVATLARLVWVQHFDSMQVSDFGTYYACGLKMAWPNLALPDLDCGRIYQIRAFFYSFPIFRVFGDSLKAIELSNIFLFLISSLTYLFLAIRLIGTNAAVLGLPVFCFFPDLFYSVTLTSHDNPGITYLGFGFALYLILQKQIEEKKWPTSLVLSLALGLVLLLLMWQRSYHHPFAAMMLIGVFLPLVNGDTFKAILPRVALLVAIPLFVFVVLGSYLKNQVITGPQNLSMSMSGYLTATQIDGSNRYSELSRWRAYVHPVLVKADRADTAIGKILVEWGQDPGLGLRHVQRKNRILSDGAGVYRFARRPLEPASDVTGGQVTVVNNQHTSIQRLWIAIFTIAGWLVILARLALVRSIPFKEEEYPIWGFSVILYLLLLFIGEAQPRYNIFLIYPLSLSAGLVFSYLFKTSPKNWLSSIGLIDARKLVLRWLCLFVAFAVICYMMLGAGVFFFGMKNLKKVELAPPEIEGYKTLDKIRVRKTFNRVSVEFKGERDRVIPEKTAFVLHKRFESKAGEQQQIEFMISSVATQYQKESPWPEGSIVHEIRTQDGLVATLNPKEFLARRIVIPTLGKPVVDVEILTRIEKPITLPPEYRGILWWEVPRLVAARSNR